jgi:pimeloyl-ACP methyl ester carboxylesterase
VAWRLKPWIARVGLALLSRRLGRPPEPHEYVNWQVWARADRETGPMWRTFLHEQRALLRELHELERAIPSVQAPVLLLADPRDTIVRIGTARLLAQSLPDACLQLVHGAGHHLPRRAPDTVAAAIVAFLAAEKDPRPAGGQSARR